MTADANKSTSTASDRSSVMAALVAGNLERRRRSSWGAAVSVQALGVVGFAMQHAADVRASLSDGNPSNRHWRAAWA